MTDTPCCVLICFSIQKNWMSGNAGHVPQGHRHSTLPSRDSHINWHEDELDTFPDGPSGELFDPIQDTWMKHALWKTDGSVCVPINSSGSQGVTFWSVPHTDDFCATPEWKGSLLRSAVCFVLFSDRALPTQRSIRIGVKRNPCSYTPGSPWRYCASHGKTSLYACAFIICLGLFFFLTKALMNKNVLYFTLKSKDFFYYIIISKTYPSSPNTYFCN